MSLCANPDLIKVATTLSTITASPKLPFDAASTPVLNSSHSQPQVSI